MHITNPYDFTNYDLFLYGVFFFRTGCSLSAGNFAGLRILGLKQLVSSGRIYNAG